MPSPLHLCTCGDAAVRVGLHVMAGSALHALPADAEVHLWVIDLGLAPDEAASLRETIRRSGRRCELHVLPADLSLLGPRDTLRRFYGSFAPYFKLLLAAALPGLPRVVYLDTDTVVCSDLAELYGTDLGENVAGAVVEGPISLALEGGYFQRVGFPPDGVCFNSGVLLLDLPRWEREGLTAAALALVRRDAADMLSADQTALNVILRNKYLPLPKKFNQLAYPSSPAIDPATAQGIWHLVGRPKPWDLFGEWFSRQGPFFAPHLERTALAGWRSYHRPCWQEVRRMGRLARSYWKAVAKR